MGAERVTVVWNPAAGRGQAARRRPELDAALSEAAARAGAREYEVLATAGPGDGERQAARAAAAGATVVAAAGGDGTMGEVVNGIAGTAASLAVLPLGTGNDFARCLGVGLDVRRAATTLFGGRRRAVDLGRAQARWFANVAGCGLDAAVAERVNRGYRRLRGTAAYVAALGETLLRYRAAMLRVEVDGSAMELRALLCSVANTVSYGGGMRIAPDALVDDGLLDVCVLAEVGFVEFAAAFPRVYRGTHTTHPRVHMLRGRAIRVESDRPLPVLVDGEVVGRTPLVCSVAHAAIEVMVPADGG